jgi:hypothetical protein
VIVISTGAILIVTAFLRLLLVITQNKQTEAVMQLTTIEKNNLQFLFPWCSLGFLVGFFKVGSTKKTQSVFLGLKWSVQTLYEHKQM